MLQITKQKDNRTVKAIVHKVADIPGGVTVSVADLGGSVLKGGTVIGAPGNDGLCHVVKTAQVVTAVAATDTTIKVAKGRRFKAGDFVGNGSKGGEIANIDKTDASFDVITLKAAFDGTLAVGNGIFQASAVGGTKLKVTPFAVIGESYTLDGGNQFSSAWLIAVVRESNAPVAPSAVKDALKGVHFI